MKDNGVLGNDVVLQLLAQNTKNFSGAEIEAVVKNVASFAFTWEVDVNNLNKELNLEDIKVSQGDF